MIFLFKFLLSGTINKLICRFIGFCPSLWSLRALYLCIVSETMAQPEFRLMKKASVCRASGVKDFLNMEQTRICEINTEEVNMWSAETPPQLYLDFLQAPCRQVKVTNLFRWRGAVLSVWFAWPQFTMYIAQSDLSRRRSPHSLSKGLV